jgi:hypothetical protein
MAFPDVQDAVKRPYTEGSPFLFFIEFSNKI